MATSRPTFALAVLLMSLALGPVLGSLEKGPPVVGAAELGAPRWDGSLAGHSTSVLTREDRASTGPLECFQVAQPVLGPAGPIPASSPEGGSGGNWQWGPSCSLLLMDHSFGFSYGLPFIANYTPPDCDFNRVIVNFTVTSAGRQFDRLALMYFGDTEVWRTSTAEPRAKPGIVWTYWKDMTEYLTLWKSPQKLIFDLGNLIDDKYTGPFNTTLTATFFKGDSELVARHPPADLVIPISARKGGANAISAWNVPEQEAVNTINFPRNVRRAVFSVSANGQSGLEEFWWANVFQSDVATFNATVGELAGFSPFREVQVLIDGKLAGVQWPFPVIFTGGISPSFHRPIVGIDAFDLREHEIDITPWLPVLCDGRDHTFKIQIAGIDDTGREPVLTDAVGMYWVVTGKIFVWLDEEGSVTTGEPPSVTRMDHHIQSTRDLTQDSDGWNETLAYSLKVERGLTILGNVVTQNGLVRPAWSQVLSYSQKGIITQYGFDQINDMRITGTDRSTGPADYQTTYSFPLYANSTYTISPNNDLSIDAHLYQGLDLEVRGAAVFPTGLEAFTGDGQLCHEKCVASKLSTFRDGTAAFFQTGDGKNSSGYGTTHQFFYFGGLAAALDGKPGVELYYRNVTASNDSVVFDREVLAGAQQNVFAVLHPKQLNSHDRQFAAAALSAPGLRGVADGRFNLRVSGKR